MMLPFTRARRLSPEHMLKRRELFLAPTGKSPHGLLSSIRDRIATYPEPSCYFVDSAGLLFVIEVEASNAGSGLMASFGVTERRFVELLFGSQGRINEKSQIITASVGSLDASHLEPTFWRRRGSSAAAFARAAIDEVEALLSKIDSLPRILDALVSEQPEFIRAAPRDMHRRALHAAIIARLLDAPWRELIDCAKRSLSPSDVALSVRVEHRCEGYSIPRSDSANRQFVS